MTNRVGEQMSTKAAILGLAKADDELQAILLRKIGALDHIATCVHFDFVWNKTSTTVEAAAALVEEDVDVVGTVCGDWSACPAGPPNPPIKVHP